MPCLNPCGSNVGINFPLIPGNTGWLIAADRNTANFQQSKGVADPPTDDLHQYAYGVFIPDIIHDFVITPEDDGALVIETADAKTRISIKGGQITLTSENNIKVNAVTADVFATTSASLTCPTTTITGNIVVSGGITTTGDVVAGGISLINHKHWDTSSQTVITGSPVQQG